MNLKEHSKIPLSQYSKYYFCEFADDISTDEIMQTVKKTFIFFFLFT